VNDADVPSNEVLGYYLKEAYYFDTATSAFRVQPVALCPVLFRQDDEAAADTRYPPFLDSPMENWSPTPAGMPPDGLPPSTTTSRRR